MQSFFFRVPLSSTTKYPDVDILEESIYICVRYRDIQRYMFILDWDVLKLFHLERGIFSKGHNDSPKWTIVQWATMFCLFYIYELLILRSLLASFNSFSKIACSQLAFSRNSTHQVARKFCKKCPPGINAHSCFLQFFNSTIYLYWMYSGTVRIFVQQMCPNCHCPNRIIIYTFTSLYYPPTSHRTTLPKKKSSSWRKVEI